MKLHTTAPEDGALGILLACHGRIRSFCEMSVRLAEARSVSDEAVSATAAALHRYFTVAFPLHAEDEEVRIAEALAGQVLSSDAADLMQRLAGEHRALDAHLALAVPLWSALVERPGELEVVRTNLAAPTQAFRDLVLAHLLEEEGALFPEIARLVPAETLREVAVAMRARRTGSSLALDAPGRS